MRIDLSRYESHCVPDQPKIISIDRGSKCQHEAVNRSRQNVRQYHVDGEVIADQNIEKCDWMVLNDDAEKAYLIELKGSDIHKAARQMDSTYRMMKETLSNYKFHYRIIYRTGTQRLKDAKTIRWKEECKKQKIDVVIHEKQYSENIS